MSKVTKNFFSLYIQIVYQVLKNKSLILLSRSELELRISRKDK